jgi:hypothetical protein
VRRASPAIVDIGDESEQDGRISEQCGGCTRGKSCGIDSGSRVAVTVKRAVRVRMPLKWVPLRLCVCRASAAIVDDEEETNRTGTRGKSMRLSGAMSTSCRLLCWTPPDHLVRSSAMDLE